MDFSRFLKQMRNGYEYDGQIAHIEEIPEREAVFGSIEQSLNPDIVAGLEAQGITQLYQHQPSRPPSRASIRSS